jgi:hypothetical protein
MSSLCRPRRAATALVLLLLFGIATTGAAAAEKDGVWVGGVVHTLLVTGPAPANPAHVSPLYVIAPISVTHPLHPLADARTHGFGAHDHVIATGSPAGSFRGVCELTLVVPGPKAALGRNVEARPTMTPAGRKPLLFAARVDGRLVPLDRAARIERARTLGLATLVDTQVGFACTVRPRSG